MNLKYDYFRLNETAYRRIEPGFFVGGGLNVSIHNDVRPGGSGDRHSGSRRRMRSTAPPTASPSTARPPRVRASAFSTTRATTRSTPTTGCWRTPSTGRISRLSRRRLDVAVAEHRHADLPAADARCPSEAGVLVPRQPRHRRDRAVFRFTGDQLRRTLGARLQRRPLSGRASPVRRSRISRRAHQNGLLGVVAFLNTTLVDNPTTGQKLFDSPAPGAGFGFRALLNKRSRTNFYTDWGWGKDGVARPLHRDSGSLLATDASGLALWSNSSGDTFSCRRILKKSGGPISRPPCSGMVTDRPSL